MSILVRFEQLGRETERLKSYTLESSYTTSTDGFSFSLFETDLSLVRGLEMQPVEIFVDGKSQLLGRIDATTIGDDGTAIKCEGRDYLSDMVECHVDPSLKLKKDMTLDDALLLAAGPVGIDTVVFEGDVGLRNVRTGRTISAPAPPGFKAAKVGEYKPKPGEGLFEYCNRLVSRQGATLQPSTARTELQIAKPNYGQDTAYDIHRRIGDPGSAHNKVITATARRNFSSFPTHVLVTGKQGRGGSVQSPLAITLGLAPGDTASFQGKSPLVSEAKIAPPSGDVDDTLFHRGRIKPTDPPKTGVGLYRLHHRRDEQSRTQVELERVQLRILAERLKDTLLYTVKLRGHADPDTRAVYAPDTIVEVDDEVCDVRERLWVESRTFSYAQNEGPTTTLECWRLGTFAI